LRKGLSLSISIPSPFARTIGSGPPKSERGGTTQAEEFVMRRATSPYFMDLLGVCAAFLVAGVIFVGVF
jgi:hypothetical protein